MVEPARAKADSVRLDAFAIAKLPARRERESDSGSAVDGGSQSQFNGTSAGADRIACAGLVLAQPAAACKQRWDGDHAAGRLGVERARYKHGPERGSRDCRDAPQATVSTAGSRSSLPASRLQPNDAAASGFARRADRSSDERRSAKQRSAALLIAASEARVRREQRPVCICRPTRSPPGLGRPRVRLPAVGMSPKALTRCARPEYEDRQTSSAPPDVCVLKLSSSGLPVPVRAKGAVAGSGGLPCLLLARA